MATRVEQRPLGGPPRSTSTTAMPPVRPKGQTNSGGPNRGAMIGIAAAVVIAVIVGVILVTNRMNHTTADGSGGGGGGSQAGGSTSATSTTPPATVINREPVTSQPDLVAQQKAITDFYAQLPGNAQNAAQAFLTPDFQGGAEAFVSQMSGLKSVTLDNLQPGDFFFRADEHLVAKDGSKTVQPVGIGLKWANSQLYIQKVQNLGAAHSE
jgi:hypothetical protein